jgi:hypothetical protein
MLQPVFSLTYTTYSCLGNGDTETHLQFGQWNGDIVVVVVVVMVIMLMMTMMIMMAVMTTMMMMMTVFSIMNLLNCHRWLSSLF